MRGYICIYVRGYIGMMDKKLGTTTLLVWKIWGFIVGKKGI